ncbi:hypothetical protein QBC34DRAFT_213171 [Podospora aff. communis PSN243]|uniref:Uncharacterized protein n=1 Tax=Podospora aff. communis PSN243 TaxID=3040156 RepID=A0AAV9G4M9_9PEZI|nr:hypothetical protein QBC34DRAFT_213171 [Podospora aff. communis PSN243]
METEVLCTSLNECLFKMSLQERGRGRKNGVLCIGSTRPLSSLPCTDGPIALKGRDYDVIHFPRKHRQKHLFTTHLLQHHIDNLYRQTPPTFQVNMSHHSPMRFCDLPQEIRDQICCKVKNAPGVHFLDFYTNEVPEEWDAFFSWKSMAMLVEAQREAIAAKAENRPPNSVSVPSLSGESREEYVASEYSAKLTMPQIQDTLGKASAFYSRGLKLRQVSHSMRHYMDMLEELDANRGKSPGVETWKIHTDLLSPRILSMEVNTEQDLVCLLQPLRPADGFRWGTSLGDGSAQHLKRVKNLAMIWDANMYKFYCHGCTDLELRYRVLLKQVKKRDGLRQSRALHNIPKPTCRMCTAVYESSGDAKDARQKLINDRLERIRDRLATCRVADWYKASERIYPLETYDDDTVSICSEDADHDDYRFFNISGQALMAEHKASLELDGMREYQQYPSYTCCRRSLSFDWNNQLDDNSSGSNSGSVEEDEDDQDPCSLWGGFHPARPRLRELEISPSMFKQEPGQDPKKVPIPPSPQQAHQDSVPAVRHGVHVPCRRKESIGFDANDLIGPIERGSELLDLERLYMIDYSIALRPGEAIPLDGTHWFDGSGGVYVQVKQDDTRWIFDDGDPFRRTVFEFLEYLDPVLSDSDSEDGSESDLSDSNSEAESQQPHQACKFGVLAYVRVSDGGRFPGLASADGEFGTPVL